MDDDELHKWLLNSDTLYCCYCLEEKGEKFGCCKENHFVTYSDLYEEDQKIILAEYQE